MKGHFRISVDGETVSEFDNLITTDGKSLIARYLAGLSSSYAGAIVVGVGTTAATVSDKAAEFEIVRTPIITRSVSGPDGSGIYQISFKGTLHRDIEGVIAESGIISQIFNGYSGIYGDKIIAQFIDSEGWQIASQSGMTAARVLNNDEILDSGTPSLNVVRISQQGWYFDVASNPGSVTITNNNLQTDFSGYSGADQFGFALSSKYLNANTTITVRFYTDDSNYYSSALSPTVNTSSTWIYQTLKVAKSSFSATGSPDWGNISKIGVIISSTNTSTEFVIDGIAVLDTDYINPDYVLVSRALPATPIWKKSGKTMDIEYFLEFKL